MSEIIVRMNGDHIKVKGGEYVRDYERGEWVRHENPRYEYDRENGDTEAGIWYSCSICQSIPVYKSNFCPNCGADMRKESE